MFSLVGFLTNETPPQYSRLVNVSLKFSIKTYESKGLTPHLTTHHEINCV